MQASHALRKLKLNNIDMKSLNLMISKRCDLIMIIALEVSIILVYIKKLCYQKNGMVRT